MDVHLETLMDFNFYNLSRTESGRFYSIIEKTSGAARRRERGKFPIAGADDGIDRV